MKRVLALAVACLLVAGAVLLRDAVSDDEDEVSTGDSGDGGGGDSDLVVACIPELREACEALDRDAEFHFEDPAATIAAVAEGEEIDAWVTLDPWPEIADIEAGRLLFGDQVMPVAMSDLVLIARSNELPPECPEPPTWTCLVDGLGDDVAVPAPGYALSPIVLGHAAEDFFPGVVRNDLADPELTRRLNGLDTSLPDPVDEIRIGLPEPSATGTTEVGISTLGARLDAFTRSPGAAPASVAVVVAGPDADRVAGEPSFTDALADLGWEVRDDAATTGLPDAGVLVALSEFVA